MNKEVECQWVKCHRIEWEEEREDLPKMLESICVTLPGESDNLDIEISIAIDNYLKAHYNAEGCCTCFSIYDDKDCERLDLQLLLGACFK